MLKRVSPGRLPVIGAALIVTLLVFCEPILTDFYEPNDNFIDAKEINSGQNVNATIEPSGDLDFFSLNVPTASELEYQLTVPAPIRPEIHIYNSAQMDIHNEYSSVAGEDLVGNVMVPAGQVYVRVSSFSFEESDTNYVLRITLSPPAAAYR